MSYPDNGSPYGVLASGSARTEMVLTNLLDDRPTLLLDDSADVIAAEVAAIKADRALAAARAKLAAPETDMGGTTLDLSDAEDARLVRWALHHIAVLNDHEGNHANATRALRLRKQINQGVVRNCERRTEAGK